MKYINWINYNNDYKYCFVDVENCSDCLETIDTMYRCYDDIVNVRLNKKKINIYNKMYMSFDIETTQYENNTYMYIAQIQLNNYIFLCRDWCIVENIFNHISQYENITVCAVANLSYEWQFIRKRFNFDYIFAKEKRKILQAKFENLMFIDILPLNNSNLKQLAKTYTKTQKLDGEKFDYKKIRNKETKLTDYEIAYCLNDTIICVEFMQYLFNNIINKYGYIPLTSTHIIRKECIRRLKNEMTKEEIKKYLVSNHFKQFTESDYNIYSDYLFRGGYVHSTYIYTNKILNNVQAYDKKSSYIQSMLFKYVPRGTFKDYSRLLKIYGLETFLNRYCCIIKVKFENIVAKGFTSLESKHKIYDSKNITVDNGRILKADSLTVYLTELDFELYKLYYKWDKMQVLELKCASRGMLPEFIRNNVLHYFDLKNNLDSESNEYKLAKAKLNSHYGMCVTKKNSLDYVYSNGEVLEETIENAKENQYFNFSWGIWITAHSRHDLMVLSNKLTKIYYNDTDSIYTEQNENNQKIIDEYNTKTIEQQKELCKKYGYNVKDVEKLGIYENDGFYTKFKTLGAKRYICEKNDKIKITVAGLPKDTQGIDFDNFANDLCVKHCKTTTQYNDDKTSVYIDDGITNVYHEELSNVNIIDIDFNMSMSNDYMTLVNNANILYSRGSFIR